MRLSMIFVIVSLVFLFFFFRVDATSYFYFFKSRFKDESEKQLFDNCEVVKETFNIRENNLSYVGTISGEPYSILYDEVDGYDVDLLYGNEFFFGELESYYGDLSRYEDLDEVVDLMGVSYRYYSEDLEVEEVSLEDETEEGLIGFEEGEDDIEESQAIEELFLPERWDETRSISDIISSEEVYETYEDAKEYCFSELMEQNVVEGDPEWWLCDVYEKVGGDLQNKIYEVEKFLEKWKVQRELISIPRSSSSYFDSFFKVLYLNKNFVLRIPRRLLLRRHSKFVFVKLGLFSWLVSFCKNFFGFDSVEQWVVLSSLRELGGYEYVNFFRVSQNLYLFFHFFLSNLNNLSYISFVGSLSKITKKDLKVAFIEKRREELEQFFAYDFETLFQLFGIDFHWLYFFLFLRTMWLFVDLVELQVIVIDLCVFLKYYVEHSDFSESVRSNLLEVVKEFEEIRLILGDLLFFLYFYLIKQFLICDEYWFYLFGSSFSLPDYFFLFFEFFARSVSKDCIRSIEKVSN